MESREETIDFAPSLIKEELQGFINERFVPRSKMTRIKGILKRDIALYKTALAKGVMVGEGSKVKVHEPHKF